MIGGAPHQVCTLAYHHLCAKETVNVPLIVRAGAIVVGVFLLVGVGRK